MKIHRLVATDLFSYETLDVSLEDQGLVLVEGENVDLGGSNGSGKSNLFKSLVWTIFGVAPQDSGNITGDDVIREDQNHSPITGKTRGYVEIQTETSKIEIYRHRKHTEYRNKVLLYVESQDETMGSDRETQAKIDEYLGTDYEAFVHSVMFPQDADGFARLTDAQQKGILDSLLGTGRFERARKRAKEQLSELIEAFQKFQLKMSGLRAKEVSLKETLENLRQQEQVWHAQLVQSIEDLQAERKILEDNPPAVMPVEDLVARRDELASVVSEEALSEMRIRREGLVARYRSLSDYLVDASGWDGLPEPKWEGQVPSGCGPEEDPGVQQKSHADLVRAETDLAALHRQLAEARAVGSRRSATHCQECGQELTEEARDRLFGRLSDRAADLESKVADAERVLRDSKAYFQDVSAWHEHIINSKTWRMAKEGIESARSELKQIESQGFLLKQSIEKAEAEHAEYRSVLDQIEKVVAVEKQWRDQITAIQLRLRDLKNSTSPYCDLIESTMQSLRSVVLEYRRMESLTRPLDSQIESLRFWEAGFGPKGVRSLLLDHVTPELNRIANDYLAHLSNGIASMRFHTTKKLKSGDSRDAFHVEVEYSNGGGQYKKISGGERQRPNIAAMFALGDLAAARARSPIGLRLLDEPFDGLDSVGAEAVIELIKSKIVPKVGTVLVMTHDSNLKQLINKRWCVTKEGGVSVLDTGN